MKFADSLTRSFLEQSSPAWRSAYATQRPSKFADYEDPTYIGFYLKFYGFNELPTGQPSLDTWPGGLLYSEDHPDSAISYLKRIGEYTRAQMVREFIAGLKDISEKTPWFFTKVSGLAEIWKIAPGNSFRGKDKKLSFETLESIDLKITYLMDLYRKATFDSVHMRWILPENLRWFDMDLVITEIRSMQRPADLVVPTNDRNIAQSMNSYKNPLDTGLFGNINIPGLAEQGIQAAVNAVLPTSQATTALSNTLTDALQRDPGKFSSFPTLMQNFDSLATFMVFSFSGCQFSIEEDSPSYFDSIAKTPEKEATNKITITTPIIRESNTYGLLGAILQDTPTASERNDSKVDSLFWKKTGNDANDAGIPSSEIGYLLGIKNSSFNNLRDQTKHQDLLKAENERNSSLLGRLAEQAENIAVGAANNLAADLAARVIGRVFSNAFEPKVSQNIAKQVVLQAPEILTQSLAQVELTSVQSAISSVVSPTNTELSGPNIGSASSSSVELQAPPENSSNVSPVTLSAPTINAASSSAVQLEGAAAPSGGGGKVQLSGPTVSPAQSSTVNLQSPPVGAASSSKVDFGPDNTPPSSPSAVELSGPAIAPRALSGVELSAPNLVSVSGTKVDLSAPPTGNSSATSVQLTGANPGNISGTTVDLNSAPKKDATLGSSDLEGAAPGQSGSTKVELVEPTVSSDKPMVVNLSGASVSAINPGSTEFQSAGISSAKPGSTNLEGAGPAAVTPGKTVLAGYQPSDKDPGRTDLEASNPANPKLGEVNFESPETSKKPLAPVKLVAPPAPEKISSVEVPLTGPIKPKASEGSVDLTAPPTDEVKANLGNVDLE
jgi:uncharacterized protein YjbI with pentapeptide repeats